MAGAVLLTALVYVVAAVAASPEAPTPRPTVVLPTSEEAAKSGSATPGPDRTPAADRGPRNGGPDDDDGRGGNDDGRPDGQDDGQDDGRDEDDDDDIRVVRPSPVDVGDDDDDDDDGAGDDGGDD